MPGGGDMSLRQLLVLLLVVVPTVFLVRQVAWHALLAATGGIMFVMANGIYMFYPYWKGYGPPSRGLDRALAHGRGTGVWWWLWAYGCMVLLGISMGLLIVGTA